MATPTPSPLSDLCQALQVPYAPDSDPRREEVVVCRYMIWLLERLERPTAHSPRICKEVRDLYAEWLETGEKPSHAAWEAAAMTRSEEGCDEPGVYSGRVAWAALYLATGAHRAGDVVRAAAAAAEKWNGHGIYGLTDTGQQAAGLRGQMYRDAPVAGIDF